jgi:hypothetical protein
MVCCLQGQTCRYIHICVSRIHIPREKFIHLMYTMASRAEASNYTSGVSGGTNSMSSFSLWTRARKEYNDNWEKGLLEIA